MSDFINSPEISFEINAKGASIDTILALLQRELQMLTSEDYGQEDMSTVDPSQRVSGRIYVELTLADEKTATVDPQASLIASTEASLCRGVSDFSSLDVSLNVQRCKEVVSQRCREVS